MVLEQLISIKDAIRNPWWMFVIGGVVSVTCLFITYFVFRASLGLISSLLVTIAMTPFMLALARYHEEREEQEKDFSELNFFQRHNNIIKIYTAFFTGMILCLTILYMVLPQSSSQELFQDQENEISAIRGSFVTFETFGKIITNNLGVLFLSFTFFS